MERDRLIDSGLRLYAALDEQVKLAIDHRLGPGAWTWGELEGRLKIVNRGDDTAGTDTYYLDREPLLRAHPIEVEQHGRLLRFKRRIERL